MAFAWKPVLDLASSARLSAPRGKPQAGGHSTIGEDRRFLSCESPSVKQMSCFFRRQNSRSFNHLVRLTEAAAEIASVA
jgi:hypothetical protein